MSLSVNRILSTSMVLATPGQTKSDNTQNEVKRVARTSFSDDRLAVKNSVKGEAVFVLITVALEKGTQSGLALEPGCKHS
jgi:hypothetical protein